MKLAHDHPLTSLGGPSYPLSSIHAHYYHSGVQRVRAELPNSHTWEEVFRMEVAREQRMREAVETPNLTGAQEERITAWQNYATANGSTQFRRG
ncbi:hypothetical protein GLAREA_10287 [Glarea lozoyensis ATCC 20868]|uniref:Uncharacterized protein n=1 Tax=Glarea lozoyensis (strain ATCC 20868 / MF5171) TaxID=1116229 RepID=S3E8D8_GLAL2|nr:uncharacterized protein GLAREA_10287 [Glarea lozoyensis ATCC 20868]EPE34593.1 hypothetical protein GLAREA_10287 [Glarea lozoyensis ATCC 20868]